jgi:hypothetical protein
MFVGVAAADAPFSIGHLTNARTNSKMIAAYGISAINPIDPGHPALAKMRQNSHDGIVRISSTMMIGASIKANKGCIKLSSVDGPFYVMARVASQPEAVA